MTKIKDIVVDLTLCGSANGPSVHGGGLYGIRLAEYLSTHTNGVRLHLLTSGDLCLHHSSNTNVYEWHKAPFIPTALDKATTLVIYPLPYRYFDFPRLGVQHAKIAIAILGFRFWEIHRQKQYYLDQLTTDSPHHFATVIQTDLNRFHRALRSLRQDDIIICLNTLVADAIQLQFPDIILNPLILPPLITDPAANKSSNEKLSRNHIKFVFFSPERDEKNYKLLEKSISQYAKNQDTFEIMVICDASKKIKYLESNIVRIINGPISEDQKEDLINESDCLIYPSLSEGYGMPPLEFLRAGKPSIVSAISPMIEMLENNAIYVNPCDPFDMYLKIKKVEREIVDLRMNSEKYIRHFRSLKTDTANKYQSFVRGINQ